MTGLWKNEMEHLARFNAGSNRELYRILTQLTPGALVSDRGSWFGSLTGMLNHIIVTDIHWLDRFRPLDPEAAVFTDGRLGSFSLEWKPLSEDFSVLSEGRRVVDDLISEWFVWFPEENYARDLSYLDSGGRTQSTTAARAFSFLFSHQNYHRGQISQVLDEIGLPNSFMDNLKYQAS